MEQPGDLGTVAKRPLRRAPLVPAALAMVAGIVLGRYLAVPLGVWVALGAAGLGTAVLSFPREHLRVVTTGAIMAAVCFCSATAAALAYYRIPSDHVVCFSSNGSILATVRGTVVSAPRIQPAGKAYWQPPATTFLLDAGPIRRTDGEWMPAQGLVRVGIGEPAMDLSAGQKVELVGTLRRFHPAGNPGQYDWKTGNRHKGILVAFSVPGRDGVEVLTQAGRGALEGIPVRLRGLLRRHLDTCGQVEESRLLEALVLGERDPALRELNRAMVEAGVAHFLSISGLHLGIFLAFIFGVLRLLAFSPRRSAAVVLVILAAYVLVAEPRPPLLRGALMAAAFCVAVIAGRTISAANALAAAAIVLLIIDPLQLFTPGFQLSFGIVCGIVVLHGPIRQALFGRWLRRRGLMVFRSRQRMRRWVYFRLTNWAIALVCISLASYLTAAPLVAFHFGLFCPWAAVLSILLLPVVIAVLLPAYVSMALATVLPNLAASVGALAARGAGVLSHAVWAIGGLPGLSLDVRPIPPWLVIQCYATMGLWVVARGRRAATASAIAATAALAATLIWSQLTASAPPSGRLHMLDVGHGSMMLLHSPSGKVYLFDAGTLGSLDAYEEILRPFLRAKRLPAPEAVFVSHANIDHFNALEGLLGRTPPERLYVNEWFAAPDSGSPPEAAGLIESACLAGVEVTRLHAGQQVRLDDQTLVEVLWPPEHPPTPLNLNDGSLVLRVTCSGRSVLLTGDVGPLVQAQLAGWPPEAIHADVLLLPHHGSAGPSLKPFIDTVSPEVLLQSSSLRQDSEALLSAVAGRRRHVTAIHGWTCVKLEDSAFPAEMMRP